MSSTDTATLEVISKEALRLFPKSIVSPQERIPQPDGKCFKGPHAEIYGIEIRTFEDLNIEFGQYVIILLGNHGWEPCFSEHQKPFETQTSTRRIDFRKVSLYS